MHFPTYGVVGAVLFLNNESVDMKAVVFLGESKLEIREYPDPLPEPDGVVVRMKASGMCGSDLHHLQGPLRTGRELVIEGHEPCGIVELVGDAVRPTEAKVGDRVMIHHYDGCRTCQYCRSGFTQYCPNARTIYGGDGDGGHADFMKVPAHTLIKLPDSLSFKTGAAISCGTGTAFAAIKRAGLSADDTVAIFGQGPVGLSATVLAKAFGARVIAVDIEPSRLEMAKKFGADFVVNSSHQDPVAAVRELTRNGEGADKSIECSANTIVRRQSIQALRRWGTVCMVGVFGKVEFDSEELIQLQKTVVGSLTFSKNQQEECAQFVAERGLDVESLFTNEFRLDEAERAYELFDQRKIGKGVFVFN
ncbi:threonine dehydrogenase-like Zn-dependent dehydrogenase [Paenarthrobacter nicotinovorans]|uniref:zinc-dependent alcohol dehydrogenase family protein n=1 Tax=Micrococcaceae TaxID=1268 RepID=UPI000876269F|nr:MULTISPECIES: zinc-binding dehydrogenase [Micrococcaceae]MDR6438670.1 threonine dehydrogenase-like Zn-dependent dehydrogenase [Paenarthrobacter nicotinovorans]SCZ56595.1 D-arabinose 1-dehydrogenase, Zn-dependent alcohol dehydrogenase family [Arthrobacter sp. UNCCL28]